jgi:hypothetical protein
VVSNRVWIVLCVVVLTCVTCVGAQTSGTAGTISGIVQDQSSAVIPNVKVTVTNVDTTIARSTVTDEGGRYQVPGLSPGNYEVRAEAAGFQTTVRSGLTLNVGSEISIPLMLRVGEVSQLTEVTAAAPIIETTNATLGGVVDSNTVRDLPLNGRSFDQLISLESSAPTYRPQAGNGTIGFATAFTINGAWQTMNVYMMDGIELVGGALVASNPGGVLGKNMGVDAVQEFKVMTGSYSAAYGKRAGGVVDIATRSGTNGFHGSLYEFLRNSDFDARSFFDPIRSPFKRNQYGAAFGGPIKKDRTFFFANYEGLRDRSNPTFIGVFMNNDARNGFLPCKAVTPAPNPCPASGLVNVGVAANVKPYLILSPITNGIDFGDGTAQFISQKLAIANQDYGLGRIDHKLSDNNFFVGRYGITKSNSISPAAGPSQSVRSADDYNVVLEERWIASPTVLNTARVGFTRGKSLEDAVPTAPGVGPALGFYPGAPYMGAIQFSASAAVTAGVGSPLSSLGVGPGGCCITRHYIINQSDYSDQVSFSRGPHSFTTGAQVQRIQHNVNFNLAQLGTFQFASLQAFLQGSTARFTGMNPVQSTCPVSACNSADKGYRMNYFSTFLQDDYKLKRNLTLNLGIRYEFMTVPHEVNDRVANWRPVIVNGTPQITNSPTLGNPMFNGTHDLVAPRIGLAWDPFGNGKTAVRAGFGIFFDELETVFQEHLGNSPPYTNVQIISNAPFPSGFSGGGSVSLPMPQGIDPNMKVPTRLEQNLSIQQQLTPSTAVTVGYVGAHMYHLSRPIDLNTAIPQILPAGSPGCTLDPCLFYAANLPARNPNLAAATIVFSDGNSNYHAMQVDFVQRASFGLRSKISFTWSKSISDADSIDSAQTANGVWVSQEPFINNDDRSLSSFNVGRNFVANFTYDLPFKGNRFVTGWSIGGIGVLADGVPLTIFTGFNQARDLSRNNAIRPNLAPGYSNSPVLGGPDKYFDPLAFVLQPAGFYGNVGRNTLIGPGFANGDATVEKMTTVSERFKLDFRAEFFNVANNPNFGKPNTSIFTNSTGARNPTAGRITTLAGGTSGRQIQFGLKLLF